MSSAAARAAAFVNRKQYVVNPLMKTFIQRALCTTRGRVPLCVLAVLPLALGIFGSATRAIVAAPRAAPAFAVNATNDAAIKPAAASRPAFRLGTAAKPFGWATAVGDFDSDGTPDVAIADHVGRPAGAYAYRIEFLLSGHDANEVFFESTADAVTIRSFDIDHDNDLDIVVGRPLSGDAVAVWLNDGQGNFTSADARRFPSTIEGVTTLGAGDSDDVVNAVESSPRRAADVRLTARYDAPPIAVERSVTGDSDPPCSSSFLLRSGPRAPPHRSLDI
jgi:FG-GAP repeat protein